MPEKLTSQQRNAIKRRVLRCVRELKESGEHVEHREVWVTLNNHFNVETYKDLPDSQYQNAMLFLNRYGITKKAH